jgi:hypothetical protein
VRVTGISIAPLITRSLGLCDAQDHGADRAATGTSPGAIAEGNWELADDKVVVTDLEGRPIGSETLKPGDDPTVIAKRILRRGRAQRDFFRPINYPRFNLV